MGTKLAKLGDAGLSTIRELRKRKKSLRDIADFIKENWKIDISHESLRTYFEKRSLDDAPIAPEYLDKIRREIEMMNKAAKKLRKNARLLEKQGEIVKSSSVLQKAAMLYEKKARLYSMIAPKEEKNVDKQDDAVAFGQRMWMYIKKLEKAGRIRILRKTKEQDLVEEVLE